MTTPPEGEVEGPLEPIPGGQPEGEPQPWMPMPGTYGSRNAGRRQSILEAFGQIANMTDVNNAVDGVRDDVQNMGTVVQDYGTAIEELGKNRVMPWAVPTVAPLSQSINRRADPTFQLSDLMSPLMRGRSDQENHNHTHITTSEPWQMQRGMNTKGRIYYAFITPAVTRAYTQLNFMVSAVTDPCRMDIAVYVVDENRGLTRQVHQTDVLATLGIGESVVTATFPTFVADQGSYLAIGFLQHGAGNSRYILGLDDTPRPLTGAVFPPKISATNQQTGRTALPATIDGNNGTLVDFSGYWFTPYAELSEDVGIDYKMFTESWGHGAVAPRPWVPLAGAGVYSFDNGQVGASGFGTRVSIYDTPLATDYVRIRSSIAREQTGITPRRSTLIVRSNNDLSTGLGLTMLGDGPYQIITWSNTSPTSSWDSRTVQATLPVSPRLNDAIEIDFLDGDLAVRINGTVRSTLTGLDGYSGSACRFLGIQTERTGNVLVATASPRFGAWSARDLPQDDGDGGDDAGDGD